MTTPLLGDIGLVHSCGGGWLSHAAQDLIEFGTDSHYCHAFVYVGSGQIVQAVSHVETAPVTCYTDIAWSTGRLSPDNTPTPLQRQLIAKTAMSYVGEKYNIVDILAIALDQARMGHFVDGDEWWVRRLSDDHMQICSQLVVNAYRAGGIDLFPGVLAGLVSPGDLYTLYRV
jgi:uncharacterized protein YycO